MPLRLSPLQEIISGCLGLAEFRLSIHTACTVYGICSHKKQKQKQKTKTKQNKNKQKNKNKKLTKTKNKQKKNNNKKKKKKKKKLTEQK